MTSLFTPGRRPLTLPGTRRRALRRPDTRGLMTPYLSGAPLTDDEIDYDDLDILRSWRVYETHDPGQVRYFCYELAARNPGETDTGHYFKAVRLIRLTRVPRYLRDQPVYEQMRDVLVSLREKRILFLNIIAKSPKLPLVFAYGVQGTGETLEDACAQADEAFAALTFCLDGTYQQLEYEPLNVEQGELLARYQAEWNNIAMARGRPMPQGTPTGTPALLDGNRTDVANSNAALETFIRGMGDKSFMLSLVTYPLTPEDMTLAWRNIANKLSAVRSDQQGSRGVSAGVALPLGLGTSFADGAGTTHGITGSTGLGSSDGLSSSLAQGQSFTHTDGTNASHSTTLTDGHSTSVADTHSTSTALGHSVSEGQSTQASESASSSQSQSLGHSLAQGVTLGQSESLAHGQSVSQGISHNITDTAGVSQSQTATQGVSVGHSSSMSQGASMTQSHGTNSGQSLSHSASAANNWTNSVSNAMSAGQTLSNNWSQSMAESISQTWGLSSGMSDSLGHTAGSSSHSGVNGGLAGLGGNMTEGNSQSQTGSHSSNNGQSVSQTGGGSHTNGFGQSLSQALTQSLSLGESHGGSLGSSLTAANSVGVSDSLSAGQSLTATQGSSVGQSASLATGLSNSLSHAQSVGTSASVGQSATATQGVSTGQSTTDSTTTGIGQTTGYGQGLTQGQSLTNGQSLSQGVSDGRTVGVGTSQSVAQGQSAGTSSSDAYGASATSTNGASTALSKQQAVSDAWNVAMSRQASSTGSLGVVPSLSATISRQTFDEAKRALGDMLEAQMNRYHEGIEGGGMLYQMFLVTEDRETLMGASALLKDAFWGPGKDSARLPQPFHTIVIDDDDEAQRLLTHAAAFTQYRRREPVAERIEPHVYSSYVTAGEASAFSHPPTSEALGLLAQHDSMPVMAMPANRGSRDIYLGRIINGERGRVDEARFGVDLDELTHILIQGVTGLGKTTTMMRLLEQAVRLQRTVVVPPTPANPAVTSFNARAGVLCFDWMQNMRDLAHVVEPERFQLFSVSNPALGAFRWNPLEVPHETMDPGQWLGAQADNLAASFGLGEFGRSLLAEYIDKLYSANRLEEFELCPAVMSDDGTGTVLRPAIVLEPVDPALLPPSAIRTDGSGHRYANVYTHPQLSRLVSLVDMATLVLKQIEELAKPDGARLMGTAMRDRVQSVWRRIQYYAPGGQMAQMVAADPDLATRECLSIGDLIDPDRGLVTVIETDGLDLENRRVILGSVMLAVYRYGLHVGKGCYDHNGLGPGTFLVLEEAHELFGAAGESEDSASATMRANLYESMFRRARMTGLRLVAMTQNCGAIPSAVTSQTTTVFIHRTYDDEDRKRVFSLLNWSNMLGQHLREYRYLGEMPRGYCIVRLDARNSYLESAPVQILVDPPALPSVTDAQLAALAAHRSATRT